MQLTFGVEIELLVRYRVSDYEPSCAGGEGKFFAPSRYLTRSRQLGGVLRANIITILQEAGFDTNDVLDKTDYAKWTVDSDGSIECPPESGDFAYYGIEVKSPACCFSPWALTQLQKVVVLINSKFEVFVNESCALHVHVGNRHDGFPLQNLKNFSMLTAVFERQFNMLHPLHRLQNAFAETVASQFPHMSSFDRVRRINAFRTQQDLIDCYHVRKDGIISGYMAYNFKNLATTRPFKTIEFRQHEGCMEPKAIARWTYLTIALVKVANDIGARGFTQLAFNHGNDSNYNIINLLRDLNLGDMADYYQQRGIYTHPRLRWEWAGSQEERRTDQQAAEDSD